MQMTQATTTLNNNNLFPKSDVPNITLGGAHDLFALIDDDDLSAFMDDDKKSLNDEDWRLCTNCNINMQTVDSQYRCSSCGITKNIIDYDEGYTPSSLQYNTKDTSASLRIVGSDSYRYSRAFIVSTAPNYSNTQRKETTKQLHRFNSQSRKDTFPIIILQETAELFNSIQRLSVVRRGNGRLGAIAACLDFICQKNGITRKPKVIAEFIGIEESDLSRGDKLLRQLHSEGRIDILIHHDPIEDYIRQYFQKLDIDMKYKDFIIELIKEASDETKCEPNNAQQSTKCAGAIYAMGMQIQLTFDKSDIEKVCTISKATFLRYYDFLILNRKALTQVFKKHEIPRLRSKSKMSKLQKPKRKTKKEIKTVGTILQVV